MIEAQDVSIQPTASEGSHAAAGRRPSIVGSAQTNGDLGPGHPLIKEPRNVQPAAAVFGVQGGYGLLTDEPDYGETPRGEPSPSVFSFHSPETFSMEQEDPEVIDFEVIYDDVKEVQAKSLS